VIFLIIVLVYSACIALIMGIVSIISIGRTALWQAQLKVLQAAEAGDLAIGILGLRRAGTDYIKSFIKDIHWGPKNAVKKLKRAMKDADGFAALPDVVQSGAKTAMDAFDAAKKNMEAMASMTSSWTASTVQQGVNETLTSSSELTSAHQAIEAVVATIAAHRATVSKEKQAEGRQNRIKAKRMAKCFETAKLASNWRAWLECNNLVIDKDIDDQEEVRNASRFVKYTPSKSAHDGTDSAWSVPKWFEATDEGDQGQ